MLPVLPPFGETVGGHGVPGVGFIPLLPEFELCALPEEVDGVELDPVVPVVPAVPLAVPGKVPQGDEVGEVVEPLGAVVLLGAVVFGVVVLGVVDSGAVPFGVEVGEAEPGVFWVCGVCGVAVPACGVAVLAGGVAVLAGGVAGEPVVEEPVVELCPAVELPVVGLPLAGAVCATAQLAQHSTTDKSVNFPVDIFERPPEIFGVDSEIVLCTNPFSDVSPYLKRRCTYARATSG